MDKQKEILKFVYKNGETTKKEIIEAMPWDYYCNDSKHFGDIISRMVKNGSLKRIKRGVYEYNADKTIKTGNKIVPVDPTQTNLF
jgi:predicted HTH transcriptional regulator